MFSFHFRTTTDRKVKVLSSKILIVRNLGDDQEFQDEFLELTGVEYPPKTNNQWMDILLNAGFSQQEARQFLRYNGYPPLAQQDVSCLASDGSPTFTQTLMSGLRLHVAATAKKQGARRYTPDKIPKELICKALGEISADTLRRMIADDPALQHPKTSKYGRDIRFDVDALINSDLYQDGTRAAAVAEWKASKKKAAKR